MAETIYNDQYVLADPGFVDARPRYFSGMLQDILAPVKGSITALDFGGGQGLLAALMREAGFSRFASYDPFFGGAGVPASPCDLVTAFEVMEHTRDPIGTFREALAPLRPDGTLLFSTVLQPRQPDQTWWYMAPRNGHVSLHSRRSLTVIARSLGMTFLPLDGGVHLFYRSPPSRVTQAIVQRRARQIMRFASLCGVGPWVDTAWQVARSGSTQAALDPRHPARALLATLGRPMER
jgi:hypothetical protein